MATEKALPPLDWLRDELRYEPGTGLLFWKVKRNGRDMSKPIGWMTPKGYLDVTFYKYGTFRVHRLIWTMVYGEDVPVGMTIDHRNGDKADNRLKNLRLATASEQGINRSARPNKYGYRGVNFHKRTGLWQARINVDGERLFLGLFQTAEEAGSAYAKAAEKLHGKFARSA